MEYEHCLLQSDNSTCGVNDATYIVNDIETTGYIHSQWCYGYADDKISKPQVIFEFKLFGQPTCRPLSNH